MTAVILCVERLTPDPLNCLIDLVSELSCHSIGISQGLMMMVVTIIAKILGTMCASLDGP